MSRFYLSLGLIFLCAGCTAAGGGGDTSSGPVDRSVYPEGPYGADEGAVVEDHKLLTPTGEDFYFSTDIRENVDNKLLLVSTGAGWCTACIEEQPKLEEFYNTYKDSGLIIAEIIFQDIDQNPAVPEDALEWAEEFECSYPVLADGDAQFDQYQDPSLAPLIMLINLDTMTIVKKSSGFQESIFEALIQSML